MNEKKIDLSVINALVKELNKQITISDNIDAVTHHVDNIVELSKAIGLLGSISSEAVALMGDIALATKGGTSLGSSATADDLLGSLFKKKAS
jgi:hypothetical protein